MFPKTTLCKFPASRKPRQVAFLKPCS